jgi:tight adherence protein C
MYAPILLGFYLPNLVLNHQIKSRQKKINEGLPDALDLLVVCVEAGLGLNSAITRVADDCKVNNPVLSQEFYVLNLEILAGLDREQALRNLAERTGVEDLSTLCAILIQADRFGTSIATALRVQSDTLRTNRRQKLEEKAAQVAVKLIFPLLLFIFPALMVVIIGPAIVQVMENLIKK